MPSQRSQTAIIIGSTGLVGKELLQQLISSDNYDNIVNLTRRSAGIQHQKVSEYIIDFDDLDSSRDLVRGDHLFCCLGTTMKKAGSKMNFRKVDFDYVLELAKIARQNHVPGFSLVSSIGASKNSMVFYSRVKGEIEEAVSMLGFDKVNIFRPSLLLGNRSEKRTGEDVAKYTYKFFNALLPKRYKGIEASIVAKAMLKVSQSHEKGTSIYPSEKIQVLGK